MWRTSYFSLHSIGLQKRDTKAQRNSYCQPEIKLKVNMEEKNILQPAGSPKDVVKGLFVGEIYFSQLET